MRTRNNAQQPEEISSEHGRVLMLSAGSIIGAGFFVGVGETISLAGPGVLITFLLIGMVAVFVNFFLIEMALSGPKHLYFHQYVGIAFGPAAGSAVGWAYIMGMVVGPASEIVAAGMLLRQWIGSGEVVRYCWLVAFVAVLISLLARRLVLNLEFYVAFLRVFLLLGFSLLGLASILGLFPSLVPRLGTENYLPAEGFLPHGLWGVLAASIGVTMIYGGTESIGLFSEDEQSKSLNVPSITYTIVLRMVFLYSFAATVLVGILPWENASAKASPFILALQLLNTDSMVVHLFTIGILASIITLAVADMFLVERLLLLLSKDGYFPRRLFDSSCLKKRQSNSRIATRILLLAVLLVALNDDHAYLRLFYLSGFGFFFIWVMLTLAFPRYCRLAQSANPELCRHWHVPCPKLLQAIVLTILGAGLICFATTPLGRDTLLISLGWLLLPCVHWIMTRCQKK